MVLLGCQSNESTFTFVVTADMRYTAKKDYRNSSYFQRACEAINKYGRGAFMISPGDMDNGRIRHQEDSLNKYPKNSYYFHQLLRRFKVTAYICGHTHNTSIAKINYQNNSYEAKKVLYYLDLTAGVSYKEIDDTFALKKLYLFYTQFPIINNYNSTC